MDKKSYLFRFDLWTLLQGQTRVAKLKSSFSSLIIGCTGLQYEASFLEIMGQESSDVVRFDLRPLLQGQTRIAKPKSAYNSLIFGPRCCNVKPTYTFPNVGHNLEV